MRAGHVPGSRSLPFTELLSAEQIRLVHHRDREAHVHDHVLADACIALHVGQAHFASHPSEVDDAHRQSGVVAGTGRHLEHRQRPQHESDHEGGRPRQQHRPRQIERFEAEPTINEGDRFEFEIEVDRRGKYAAVNLAPIQG